MLPKAEVSHLAKIKMPLSKDRQMETLMKMSSKEISRLEVMQKLSEKQMSQKEAGVILNVNTR